MPLPQQDEFGEIPDYKRAVKSRLNAASAAR